jgi:hypothetical protein
MLTEMRLKGACGCNENRALKNNQPLPDKHKTSASNKELTYAPLQKNCLSPVLQRRENQAVQPIACHQA